MKEAQGPNMDYGLWTVFCKYVSVFRKHVARLYCIWYMNIIKNIIAWRSSAWKQQFTRKTVQVAKCTTEAARTVNSQRCQLSRTACWLSLTAMFQRDCQLQVVLIYLWNLNKTLPKVHLEWSSQPFNRTLPYALLTFVLRYVPSYLIGAL